MEKLTPIDNIIEDIYPSFEGMDEYFKKDREDFIIFCHSMMSGGIAMTIRNKYELWDKESENHKYFVKVTGLIHPDDMSSVITGAIWDKYHNEKSKTEEEGYLKGDVCNREGCKGTIDEHDTDGGCSCHISPPCSYCETPREFCPECDWESIDERDALDAAYMAKTKPKIIVPKTKEEIQKEKEERYAQDDGELYTIYRYFDSILEGTNGSDLTKGEAYRKLDELNNKDRYYVSYSMMKQIPKRDALVVGKVYDLCVTGQFCHGINSSGYLSSEMVTNEDLKDCTYVGTIHVRGTGNRQIFYRLNSQGDSPDYVMFADSNLNHIIEN